MIRLSTHSTDCIRSEEIDSRRTLDAIEPLLAAGTRRSTLYPVLYPELWDMYKAAEACFWTVEEVDLAKDLPHWRDKLTDDERFFLARVLAFFACSDGIVCDNLVQRFYTEVQASEVRCFYGYQIMIENIHAEMYSILLDTFIQDKDEKDRLFDAVNTVPSIADKASWTTRWIADTNAPFAQRLVAFAAVEGLHTTFACKVHATLSRPLPCDTIKHIIHEAVALEVAFVEESLPVAVIGMNHVLMTQYVRYVADHLLVLLGCSKSFHVPNPFDFMDLISLSGKTNFFEKRVSEYSKAGVGTVGAAEFALDADF
ncbi:ribonucleotide reductase small subunit [Phanerochaete sordida]|uniref:Ribonucleotide reductase small subunit n=1 Tax=Phanerochaete sordida TaxID=48140 RepID=A0A9P3G018_9APHY|nr:ribonucleotide reductase small subunit [Phanerochaete sordida]